MAVANSGDDNVQVFLGQGDGTFLDQGTFATGDDPAVVVGSNFNSDSATDLAVANSGGTTVTILLFAGPLADAVTVSLNEDTPGSVTLRGRILYNSPLTYILTDCPAHGTLSVGCPTSGYLTNIVYTPDTNFFGTDTFHYQATDGVATSEVATVTITILSVNDAPSFGLSAGTITVYEDSATTNISNFATNISKGPTNEFSQTVSLHMHDNEQFFLCVEADHFLASGALSLRPTMGRTEQSR